MSVSRSSRQSSAVLARRSRFGRRRYRRRVGVSVVISLALPVLAVYASASGASGYGNTSIASPVRSATTPLSSYQSGLVSRPNPIDSSSNLVVTGNIGAGKHFRGNIPYRSTTSMDMPLGSTSLDSFMRYTASPETPATSTGRSSPFYSASGTASVMQPGMRSVFSPGTSYVAPRAVDATRDALYLDVSPRVTLPGETDSTTGDNGLGTAPRLQLWPLSDGPEAARRGPSNGLGESLLERRVSPRPTETLTGDDYRQHMEALQRRLGEVKAEVAQLEQSLAVRDALAQSSLDHLNSGLGNESESEIPEGSRKKQLLQETARLLAGTMGLPDQPMRYEQAMPLNSEMDVVSETQTGSEQRLQLYDPSRVLSQTGSVRSQPAIETHQFSRVGLAPPVSSKPYMPLGRASPTPRAFDMSVSGTQSRDLKTSPERTAPETVVVQTSVTSPIKKVDTALAATSSKEFTRHLQLAERYFQRGAYRHAAEAYALAITYRPNDPRAHLGRSHALLAAGEYAASAASLALAVEIDSPSVVKQRDLIEIVGGPDAFIVRFNDLNETVQAKASPQLQFLLAYIYYQMDRAEEARTAIEAAQRTSPSSISIDLLKAEICR
jgi:tetratricopeptide (TPR) repeat protein